MPTHEIECADRKTGKKYTQLVEAKNYENAKIRTINEGHLVVGSEDLCVAPESEHLPVAAVTIEDRLDRIEKRIPTIWTIAFGILLASLIPIVIAVLVLLFTGVIHKMFS